jgi:hypothetical protein
MCYADPAKSLELSRARLTPEQWEKFEADFEHCCDHSGLRPSVMQGNRAEIASTIAWAKWFYLCGKGL